MSPNLQLAALHQTQVLPTPTPGNSDDLDDPETKLDSSQTAQSDPSEEKYGPLLFIDGDRVGLNLPAIAAKYADETQSAYSPVTRLHHRFDPVEGIWSALSYSQATWDVVVFLRRLANLMKAPRLLTKITPSICSAILQLVEGYAPMGTSPPPSAKLVPVANGVLDLTESKARLRPYRADDWFTSKGRIAYVKGAKCERFLNELIRPALPNEVDVNLLQRDLGRQLVPGNTAQTISLFVGEGGSGKGVLALIIEYMTGEGKVGYLRTDKLTGRFETDGYHGKSLLTGKDVSPDFFNGDGAAMIKSLTGSDRIESERKYGGKHELFGSFYMIVTANKVPTIKIQGDHGAWRRRFLVYNFSREKPEVGVPNFDKELIRLEGEGILAWLVEGYFEHQKELAECGRFKLTEEQARRVEDFLLESEGERAFVRMSIVKGPGTLTVDEIWRAYQQFARERKWTIPSSQKFFTMLPEAMMEYFGVERDNHITRNGKAVRGFRHVSFKDSNDEI